LLFLTVVRTIVADPLVKMPPASASCSTSNGKKLGTSAETSTLLSLIALSSIARTPLDPIPPPSANLPFGRIVAALLSRTTLRESVSVAPGWLLMPPPSAMVAADPSVVVEPARLSVTRVPVRVRLPALSMPPPHATAHGLRPQNPPAGKRPDGETRLPVMTLSEIATFATGRPGPGNGIDTPP